MTDRQFDPNHPTNSLPEPKVVTTSSDSAFGSPTVHPRKSAASGRPLWHYLSTGVALLLLGLLFGWHLGKNNDPKSVPVQTSVDHPSTAPSIAMTVEAVRPRMMNMTSAIHANGVIAGKDEASVGTRMSGVAIERVLVEAGQYVKAGQVLAVLDDEIARQEVLAATATLHTAEAGLAKASADLSRVEPLIAIDAISKEQYDAYRTAKVQAQNDVIAAKARLHSSQINRNNSQVLAPVSGIISQKNAEVGMMTTGAPLFTIIKGGQLEWQASIPADQMVGVRIGQPVRLASPFDQAAPDTTLVQSTADAVITRIAPVANASRDLTVHATIAEGTPLVAGMYVTGELLVGSASHQTVPTSAVVIADGREYVYVLTATDTADVYQVNRTSVEITMRQADSVAVDLPADALVVRQGGSFLNDKDLVKVSQIVSDTTVQPSLNQ